MIRQYKPSDRNRLIELFNRNVPEYFDPTELRDLEEYLEIHSSTYLSIEIDNTIVGAAGYHFNEEDKSGRVSWIFFDPKSSGKGLGKAAVQYCIEKLKADERVEKLVVTTSQLAYLFFAKFGYEVVRTEKDYWGPGLDLYLMEQEFRK